MPTRAADAKAASPSASGSETRRIMAKLAAQHPDPDTELNFSSPYELLVATILSAQCTDARVNQVTPALFRRYPDARSLAEAPAAELEPQIQSTGFFRAKSRALTSMAQALVERHGGGVPASMDALVRLPGVGRKTANVVLGHALGVPGLPVDRHVLRVANRIGIARSDDPEIVEHQLCRAMPPEQWTATSDILILHGRRICKPRPLCDRCAVRDDCNYYRSILGAVPAASGRKTKTVAKARGDRARGTGRASGAPRQRAAESRPAPVARRAPEARGTARASGAPRQQAAESRPAPVARRAPEARGTGRGGGAPRQSK